MSTTWSWLTRSNVRLVLGLAVLHLTVYFLLLFAGVIVAFLLFEEPRSAPAWSVFDAILYLLRFPGDLLWSESLADQGNVVEVAFFLGVSLLWGAVGAALVRVVEHRSAPG